MRLSLFIVALIFLFTSCGPGDAKEGGGANSDSLMDSTGLKMKADTARKQIMHIGDSIEQMQRQAESEAAD